MTTTDEPAPSWWGEVPAERAALAEARPYTLLRSYAGGWPGAEWVMGDAEWTAAVRLFASKRPVPLPTAEDLARWPDPVLMGLPVRVESGHTGLTIRVPRAGISIHYDAPSDLG